MVNKAERDVFLELSCFFNDPADVGNLISGSSVCSKCSLNLWKFTFHILLKPQLENFEHYFASMWDEFNCAIVWAFLALPFFGIRMKTDLFQSSGHGTVFQISLEISKIAAILSAALSQHHLLGFEIAQLKFFHFH